MIHESLLDFVNTLIFIFSIRSSTFLEHLFFHWYALSYFTPRSTVMWAKILFILVGDPFSSEISLTYKSLIESKLLLQKRVQFPSQISLERAFKFCVHLRALDTLTWRQVVANFTLYKKYRYRWPSILSTLLWGAASWRIPTASAALWLRREIEAEISKQ